MELQDIISLISLICGAVALVFFILTFGFSGNLNNIIESNMMAFIFFLGLSFGLFGG